MHEPSPSHVPGQGVGPVQGVVPGLGVNVQLPADEPLAMHCPAAQSVLGHCLGVVMHCLAPATPCNKMNAEGDN